MKQVKFKNGDIKTVSNNEAVGLVENGLAELVTGESPKKSTKKSQKKSSNKRQKKYSDKGLS